MTNKIVLNIDSNDIKPIAEKLLSKKVKNEGYKINTNPELMLVPEYETDADVTLPIFEGEQFFEVSGFSYWPDIEDPAYVMLDVSDDMIVQLWRDELITQIGKQNIHSNDYNPHIIILKKGDNKNKTEFNINPEVRNELLNKCEEITVPNHIKANHIDIIDN